MCLQMCMHVNIVYNCLFICAFIYVQCGQVYMCACEVCSSDVVSFSFFLCVGLNALVSKPFCIFALK